MSVNQSPAWLALAEHAKCLKDRHLADLFDEDVSRFDNFSYQTDGFLLDLSKQRIVDETLTLLVNLAEQQQLGDWVEKLFINQTPL